MIEFLGLHKGFGSDQVLRGVDLTVREGWTVALLGPSGVGKSVLIKHAIGLLNPDKGDVLVDGVSIPRASAGALRRVRRRIGYVFQGGALFDSLTVLENLWLALDDEKNPRRPQVWREVAADLLERVNLDSAVLDLRPTELSGGMRKRVGVARAIATNPRYLLYDEPTTGLDPLNAELVDNLIVELRRQLRVTSLLVTHDLETAFSVADQVALLWEGSIRISGTPEEIVKSTDPVVESFLRRGRIEVDAVARGG